MTTPEADVMLSYLADDIEFTKYIAEGLQNSGLTVWYADSKKKQDLIGQAVVNCHIFVFVVSPESVKCSETKDQLALAYISNRPIFPVALKSFRKISPSLDSAMKLMLAKINWTFFHLDQIKESSMKNLIEGIQSELKRRGEERDFLEDDEDDDDDERNDFQINSHTDFTLEEMDDDDEEDPKPKEKSSVIKCEFWERHFPDTNEVLWTDFKEKFIEDYGERIERDFGEDKVKWFINLVYRDILDLEKKFKKKVYKEFSGKNTKADPDHFYHRLEKYAVGANALREVFNIDSTVRLTAIQNLGTYQTPSVSRALFDLIEDSDPNIRAVACLALAKTGKKVTGRKATMMIEKIIDKLIKLLNDEDRLVRESACLSLAHMRAVRATNNIIDVWRNDPISTVRDAAQIAISRMGGKEASDAMKMTQVLQEEIKSLKTTKKH